MRGQNISRCLRLVASLRSANPETPLVALIDAGDLTRHLSSSLVRHGADEVVCAPADAGAELLLRQLETMVPRRLPRAAISGLLHCVRPEIRPLVGWVLRSAYRSLTAADVSLTFGADHRTLNRWLCRSGAPPISRVIGIARCAHLAHRLMGKDLDVARAAADLAFPSATAARVHVRRHLGSATTRLRVEGIDALMARWRGLFAVDRTSTS